MEYILEVVCSSRDFYAYWYGVGTVESVESRGDYAEDRYLFTVNYGSDEYRAEYQAGRFGSGLIGARVLTRALQP